MNIVCLGEYRRARKRPVTKEKHCNDNELSALRRRFLPQTTAREYLLPDERGNLQPYDSCCRSWRQI